MDHSVETRPATIAVVDDDVAILDAIQLLLESHHWTVRIYASGEAFLADFDNCIRPDCLILDPHLPGISGTDVMRILTNGKAHIPVIGLTARPTSAVAIEMSAGGADAVFTKPVTEEQLVNQIHAVLIGGVGGRTSAPYD